MKNALRIVFAIFSVMLVFLCGSCKRNTNDWVASESKSNKSNLGSASAVSSSANEIKTSDGFGYITEDNFLTLVFYSEDIENVSIPENIDGVRVRKLDDKLFHEKRNLKSVKIPNGIYEIGWSTFSGCEALQSVSIPDSVVKIGGEAFKDCKSLKEIRLSSATDMLWHYAFQNCTSLETIEIPSSVTEIDKSAFEGCSSLITVHLNEGLSKIGSMAFSGCSSLREIMIPASMTSCGNAAFMKCDSLTSFSVSPDSTVFKYENGALTDSKGETLYFYNSALKSASFNLPSTVTHINDFAFAYCPLLTSVVLSKELVSLGNNAFEGCSSLMEVTAYSGTTKLGANTFSGCDKLSIRCAMSSAIYTYATNLKIPTIVDDNLITVKGAPEENQSFGYLPLPEGELLYTAEGNEIIITGCKTISTTFAIPSQIDGKNVVAIGEYAFTDNKTITGIDLPQTLKRIDAGAFYDCANLENIRIPQNVNTIDNDAFYGCKKLRSADLSAKLSKLGTDVFFGCTSLTSINVADDNYIYCDENGVLYNRDKSQLIWYPVGKTDTDFTVPQSVKSFAMYCFADATRLKSVVLGSDIKEFNRYLFSGCTNLTSVNIPDGVTLISLGCFFGCTSLRGIDIPDSVVTIEEDVFADTSSVNIICSEGSAAHKYAQEHNISFTLR